MADILDSCANRRGGAEHDERPNQREMCERGMDRLEDVLLQAVSDDPAHRCEHAGNERELFRSEVYGAIGDLTKKNREEVGGLVDRPVRACR